ncbi:coiled-coil domain-containing protein 60 [Anolis carolinensis]|uniref:Coiled-coil domain containing 60 n=1 Tax=Anolis carolinensis TaxID=28377 RepID=H9G8H4_ANOCA|nr:PREDICTED: coiled-coil domain-containing protein 60 [Anolis carolinensis]|eukprot:XP_008116873.1 PREDICTED: coiled-coil domain-containing protein 60 [Anolis carolinensis]
MPLNPRDFVEIRPLPSPGGLEPRGLPEGATRRQVVLEGYRRRVRQLTGQGYFSPSGKPYQEFAGPLCLDPKRLTLQGLGQLPAEFLREEASYTDSIKADDSIRLKKPKPTEKAPKKSISNFRNLEKDLKNLHKELLHTSHLINTVKRGRGYFYTLRKEDEERKNTLLMEQQKEEERLRTELQPPKPVSSSSSDEDEIDRDLNEIFLTEFPFRRDTEKKKKKRFIQPFTPLHNGLLAKRHPNARYESMFRQLCVLNWLLEALTLEPTYSMRPLITCWDAKDYGGGKSTMKEINREKILQSRWEHFLTHNTAKRFGQRPLFHSQGKKVARKPVARSGSKMSGLSSPHSKTTLTSSPTPGSEEVAHLASDSARDVEDIESCYSKQTKEEEEPMSYYLQTLIQIVHEDVAKNFSKANLLFNIKRPYSHTVSTRSEPGSEVFVGTRVKSSASSSRDDRGSPGAMREGTPAEQRLKGSFIRKKEELCNEMKKHFFEVAQECAFRLHDQLDILERRREERSIQKYMCLGRLKKFRKDVERMRQATVGKEPVQDAEAENWFSTLLAKIPADAREDHRTQKILRKLQRFARNPDLRIRPITFLKVLGGLRIWEICSPDVSSAVQFLREYVIQMPAEDFKKWLRSRVSIPKPHSAPPAV